MHGKGKCKHFDASARFCYAHVMCPSASTAVTIAISSAKMLREKHGQTYGPTTWHAEGKAWPDLWADYVAC